jgi:hypothetical protein
MPISPTLAPSVTRPPGRADRPLIGRTPANIRLGMSRGDPNAPEPFQAIERGGHGSEPCPPRHGRSRAPSRTITGLTPRWRGRRWGTEPGDRSPPSDVRRCAANGNAPAEVRSHKRSCQRAPSPVAAHATRAPPSDQPHPQQRPSTPRR